MLSLYDVVLNAARMNIQRGTVTAAVAGTNVTISKVNQDRCILLCSSGRAVNDAITFVDDTTIKVTTSTAGAVGWQVIEIGDDRE